MEEPSNFGELKSKASEWNHVLEEAFINKLKTFCTTYETKYNNLASNLSNFSKNLNLIEIDYFNTIDSLKIISLQKFVEHLIDKDDVCPKKGETIINEPEQYMTSEQKEALILSNCQRSIQNSLMALPQREGKIDGDSQSVYEDNASVASSKLFSSQIERMYRNLKLPYIIGTKEFKSIPNVGLIQEIGDQDDEIQNDLKGVGLVRESEDPNFGNNDNSNNVSKNKGGNVPVPPPMNLNDQQIDNIQRQNEQQSNNAAIAQEENVSHRNQQGQIAIDDNARSQSKDLNSLLRDQMEAKGKMGHYSKDDDNSFQASLRKSQPMFARNHSSSVYNSSDNNDANNQRHQFHQTMTILNSSSGKKGITLNQFIKKDLFADEEDDEKDEVEIIPQNRFRHSTTVTEKSLRKKVNESNDSPNIIQACQDNIFALKDEDIPFESKTDKKKKRENEDLVKAKKSMLKIFEEEEDEEKEEASNPQVNVIEEKTKDLANKLKMMTDENMNDFKQPVKEIIQQPQQIGIKKGELFDDNTSSEQLPVKQQIDNKPKFNSIQSNIKEEKKKTLFFEEEDDNKGQLPPKKDIVESKISIKEEPAPSKSKANFFDSEVFSKTEVKKEESKKSSLAFLDNDEEKHNNVLDNKPIPDHKKESVMPLNTSGVPDKKPINSIQAKLDNMKKEEEDKKKAIEKPIVISKGDFNTRFSDLQNMLGGRLSGNISNPFVADNIDTRKKTIDESEEQATQSDEIKENDKSEIIHEPEPESKNEVVIIQKKKPKKKGFTLDDNNNSTTVSTLISLPETKFSQINQTTITQSIPKKEEQEIIIKPEPPVMKPKANFFASSTQAQPTNTFASNIIKEEPIQSQPKEEVQQKKIDFLFDKTDIHIEPEVFKPSQVDIQNKIINQKRLTSIFDDDSSSNPPKETSSSSKKTKSYLFSDSPLQTKKVIDQPQQIINLFEPNPKSTLSIEPKEEVESKPRFHRNTTLSNHNLTREQAAKKLKFLFEEDD